MIVTFNFLFLTDALSRRVDNIVLRNCDVRTNKCYYELGILPLRFRFRFSGIYRKICISALGQ